MVLGVGVAVARMEEVPVGLADARALEGLERDAGLADPAPLLADLLALFALQA